MSHHTNAGSLRLPSPEILREQVVLEELDLARDGSFVVVTRRIVEGDDYVSHLWAVAVPGGGEPRQITSGHVRDRRPAISPDGARIAFTRTIPGEDRASLLVTAADGDRPLALDLGELDPAQPVWSPDGSWIAFTAETGAQRFVVGERPPKPDGTRPEPTARIVRSIDYRYDEVGYLDRRSQLFVVAGDGSAAPRQVADIAGGVAGIPAWRPDGAALAIAADPRADADLRPRSSIFEVPLGGGEPREVLALAGPVRAPAYSPDGRLVAGIGVDDPDFFDDLPPTLFAAPLDASAPAVALAPDLDRPVGNWADTDLAGWMVDQRPGPVWTAPNALVALVTDRGRTHPWQFSVDPATGRPTRDPRRVGQGDAMANILAAAGGTTVVLATLGSRPPEVCLVDADGELRPLTTMGGAWLDGVAWPQMRVVEAPGPGGPVETWIASPAGAGDGPLPTVVDVHGGPLGAWSPAPSLEVALLCARGFRVVLPNIRGSTSYGREWIAPQLGATGGPDAEDVHAALDHAIALGLADPDRLGALGLSYGGFMVNWLVGTSDRFRGAVSENGVTNQIGTWASSDTGPEYCRSARMGDPTTPEGVDLLWRQSPLRHVANVHTPLLMLQGEADRRCPASDNEQFFVALRYLRRTVEFVLYPEESHLIQAVGRIDRRIDRMTRMLDWLERFVLG
jgi:dipeptidyl aminopeptidase/acylaminoacyl peptidase